MKRFLLPLLSFFILGISFPFISFAEGNRSITLLYTGFVMGNFEPYAFCGCNSMGGLARRAHMIESIRKDKRSVLLLDGGAVFGPQSDNAELHLKAMEQMGYDALNLGGPELQVGKEFLERTQSQVSFPYIAANLLYGGRRLPWIREYIIKEVGGIKVALVGILDPEDIMRIPDPEGVKGFEIIPPDAVLERLLPEVRRQADMVVLLSQLDEEKNRTLVDTIQGIDVSISSGCRTPSCKEPPEKKVVILHAGLKGMTMGFATITLDDRGAFSVSERKDVMLENSVPDDGEISLLVGLYKKEQEIKKEKRKEKEKKELLEGLKLSPKEFMERYQKEQAEKSAVPVPAR